MWFQWFCLDLDKGLICDGSSKERKWWTSECWFSAEKPAAAAKAVAPGMGGYWFGEKLCSSLNHLLLFTVPGNSSFDVPVQTEPSWMGSDRTAAQGSTAEESDVFLPMRSFVRYQYLKTEKQTKGSGLIEGKREVTCLTDQASLSRKDFSFFSQKPLSSF